MPLQPTGPAQHAAACAARFWAGPQGSRAACAGLLQVVVHIDSSGLLPVGDASAFVRSVTPLHSVHSSHGLHAAAVARALIAYHPNVSARDSDLWLGTSGLRAPMTLVHRDSLERRELRLGVADLTGTRLLAARPWSHCRLGGIQ